MILLPRHKYFNSARGGGYDGVTLLDKPLQVLLSVHMTTFP